VNLGRALPLVAALIFAPGCGDDGAGVGASCEDARDCDTGLCVDTGSGRICTMQCEGTDECPDGLTCQRFSLADEGDAGPIGESVRACAPPSDAG
jgi:hypothetical protein